MWSFDVYVVRGDELTPTILILQDPLDYYLIDQESPSRHTFKDLFRLTISDRKGGEWIGSKKKK